MAAAIRATIFHGLVTRLRLAILGALIVLATIAASPGATGVANASTVSPQDCGPWASRAIITFTSGSPGNYFCSGTYTPPNRGVNKFEAGNWSGNFVWGGRRYGYCVGDVFDFTGDARLPITSLYLSPTRIC